MEIILKEDIQGLGYKNDLVKVKPGYGRNYLIPQGLATIASESNKKMLAENLKQAAHKAEKIKTEALNLAAVLAELTPEVQAKVSETGKIFGSVTNTQLTDVLNAMLKAKGVEKEIDRRKVIINSKEINGLGEYNALVDLHKEVKQALKFKVVGA